MDNADPERHRPAPSDWRRKGGAAVEVGRADQLVVVTLGDWLRLRKLVGRRGAGLLERVWKRSDALGACGECGSSEVRR